MDKYYYFANTWKDDVPIQVEGYIEASSEEAAIQQLIDDNVIDSNRYEFLGLHVLPKAKQTDIRVGNKVQTVKGMGLVVWANDKTVVVNLDGDNGTYPFRKDSVWEITENNK